MPLNYNDLNTQPSIARSIFSDLLHAEMDALRFNRINRDEIGFMAETIRH